jgi:hypothetical protein
MVLLKYHFWLLLIIIPLFGFAVGFDELFGATEKGIANAFFSFAGFIPYFGYVYRKKFLSKEIWRLFVVGFFLWEIFCYFSYENTAVDNILIFVSVLPKYFSIAMYSFYIGSFSLPETTSLQNIETYIYSKLKALFIIIVIVSIIINAFMGITAILTIVTSGVR